LIGNLGSDDPDGNDSIEFRFVSSGTVTDNGLFQIVGTRLESAVTFDKEARDNYSIRIRASDRFGLAVERVFVINVTNVNENPTDISISNDLMTESVNVGTSVGTFAAVDPDSGDSQTFSLVSGIGSDDNSKFLIVGNDLRTAAPLDFETQRLLSIRVRATDQIGLTFEKTFVISLLNINERPTDIVLNPNSVNEGSAIGTRVGDLMAIDQDLIDGHRLEFVDTANFPDSNFFRIAGSEVRTLAVFDFDTKNSYVTRVRATDQGGLTFEKNVTILVSNINEAPSDIGLDNRSIAENMVSGTLVGNLSTVDLDGNDTFTYSLVTGAGSVDNSRFTISGNQLRSANTFDFELAQRYLIRVQSRDSGGVAIQRTFTISVNNVNEPPVSLAMTGNSIPEDAVVGAQVGTLSTQDPDVGDSFGYSLVAGAGDQDNAKFSIVGNSLRTNASLNFEQASGLSVRIRSTDSGGLQVERQLAVSVTDVNEAPVNLRLTSNLIENTPVGSVIATAAADDIDQNDGLTYSFAPGAGSADNAQFTISPQGIIRNSQSIDFESKPSYNVRVRATDNAGLFVENTFVLNVTNINEAPTSINLSSNMVNENEVPGVAVGQFTTVDPDLSDAFSYALVAGTGSDDNAQFVLVGNELRTTSSLNFESKASYTVRVRATDLGGAPIEQAFEILVKDLNESPTGMLLSNATIVESAPVGSLVGLLSTQDVDTPEAFQYALVGGAGSDDNAAFAISNNRLVSDSVFDFESKSSYSIRVRSTDRGNLFTESVFLIQILDGNDVPTNFNLSASVVNENEPAGVLIGLLSAQDSDGSDTIKFRFVAGNNDNTAFALGGVNSERLLTSSPLNFEAKSEYRVDVQAFDNSGDGPIRTFVISVQNLNEAPSNLLLSSSTLDENQPAGSLLGTFSSADEDLADSHQYQLVGGTGSTDNNKFSIVGNALRLLDSANFEAQSNYSIRVRSTDAGGLMVERILAISINDIAESPFALQLSNSSINENLGSNVTIGALSASDPDIGTVLTYALVGGAGSDDNGLFQISGSNLVATQSLNFEEAATRQVRIRATDGSGLFVDGTFTIVVNNLAETPTSIALTNTTITENRPAGTLVGLVSTVDPDAADSHVYSFAPNGNVGDKFEFVGNRLVSKARLNFEAQSSYQLTIRSTDLAGLFVDVAFVVQVLDVVELPANAVADNATTQTSREVIIDVLRNDVDPDGTIDPTTVFIVTPPTEGTARVLTDGRIEFTPPADKRATFTFSYRVRDNDAVESNVGNVSIQVYSAFQNQRRQLDVDNDGDITPLDVLAIINDINVFGVRTLPTNVPDTLPFVDTNGNGQSDPLDVLEVVNYLNLISGGAGEGETLSIAQPSSDLDAAIAMLALEDVSKRDHAQAVDASMLYLDDYYSDLVSTKNRRR
ncbi:MAG: cadherin domain-containing protein, partial [Pirellula sp.]